MTLLSHKRRNCRIFMYVWVCVYRVRMPASAWQQYAQVESVSA
jgi:hypothetical protein